MAQMALFFMKMNTIFFISIILMILFGAPRNEVIL